MEFPFGLRDSVFFRPSAFGFRISSAASGASLVLIAIVAALAGCAVGPNYQRPSALGTNAMPAAYSGAGSTNSGIWKPAQPSAHLPRGSWWEMFGDPELNGLEGLATTNN